ASFVVHDWPCRGDNRVCRFAAKSDRCTDDFLADSTPWGGNDFFCDLLLSRKCWSIFEPDLAVNSRSHRAGFYETLPSRNAGIVGERAYSDSWCSSRQHIANGPTDRAFVVNRPLRTTWTGASSKSFAHRKKYRSCWCGRDFIDSVRAWTGDPS